MYPWAFRVYTQALSFLICSYNKTSCNREFLRGGVCLGEVGEDLLQKGAAVVSFSVMLCQVSFFTCHGLKRSYGCVKNITFLA